MKQQKTLQEIIQQRTIEGYVSTDESAFIELKTGLTVGKIIEREVKDTPKKGELMYFRFSTECGTVFKGSVPGSDIPTRVRSF